VGQAKFLTVVASSLPDERTLNTACAKLGAFIETEVKPADLRGLFQAVLNPEPAGRETISKPDEGADLQAGTEWLQTLPEGIDIVKQLEREPEMHRPITFALRTFLYSAHADTLQVTLTADSVRSDILELMSKKEQTLKQTLRERLLTTLGEAFGKQPRLYDSGLTRRITPLSAIVFERAGSEKKQISRELLKLRNELSPLRERIREAEKSIFGSAADERSAYNKWEGAFKEIERKFGDGEGLVTIRGALSMAESAADMVAEPYKPKGYVKAIREVPLEIAFRMFSRRTATEIHRLKRDLPASGRLARTASRLFGEIDDP
jgi:hypothetical protein